jgi:hypothetical protein
VGGPSAAARKRPGSRVDGGRGVAARLRRGSQSGGEEARRLPDKEVRKCQILSTDGKGPIGGQKVGPEFTRQHGIHEIESLNRGWPESL